MRKNGISQEMLKLIACVSMLLDHIGASVWPSTGLRIIGRVAFPIYCFLLAEGISHTSNPRKYGLRLLAGAILSEVPFDLLIFEGFTWQHQSVMVTLLLGFLYGISAGRFQAVWLRVLWLVPFASAGDFLGTDYGGCGVAMIGMFLLLREVQERWLLQTAALAALCLAMDSFRVPLAGLRIPIELFAVAAMVPIGCYRGRKATRNAAVQWGFYLFYPLHMAALLLIQNG